MVDRRSWDIYDKAPEDLPTWRFYAHVEELFVEMMVAEPGLVGEHKIDQRTRILAALEEPIEADGIGGGTRLSRIERLRRQMLNEPDADRRADLYDQLLELSEQVAARDNPQGES